MVHFLSCSLCLSFSMDVLYQNGREWQPILDRIVVLSVGMGKTSIPKVSRFGTKLEDGASNWCPSPFGTAWLGWFANCNKDPIGGQVLVLDFAVHCGSFKF